MKLGQFLRHPKAMAPMVTGILLASQPIASVALAADVDWKYYSSSDTPSKATVDLFFDQHGLKRRADGHVEVWVKGLDNDQVMRALDDLTKNKPLLDSTARKVAAHYELPISRVQKVYQDVYLVLVGAEEVANQGKIPPTVQILYDLDCRGEMLRELSITVVERGKPVSSNESSLGWKHIPPESAGRNLLELTCGLK